MKNICFIFLLISLLITGCESSGGGVVLNTGPEVDILNMVEIGLNVNTNGELILQGEVSIPTPIHTEILDVNWNVGFEKVLIEAADKTNYLYIVWQDENNQMHMEVYDIEKPFRINFERKDWVREISNTENGTIIVSVEKQVLLAEFSWQPSLNQTWSNIVSVKMPTLNEIRADLVSIWDANLLTVGDIESPGSRTYSAIVDPNREYLWPYYWCTKDRDVLEENVKHIKIIFYVDGEVVPKDSVSYYRYDTNSSWNCGYWATVVSGWPRNSNLTMMLEYTIDAEIYDGVKSYPAGTYQHILLVEIP